MRITIIGAGVVGATSAYFVSRLGHEVTLLDRQEQPAQETSFANAGQLSYSYTDTLADPGIWRALPALLMGRDATMRIVPDVQLLPWGLRFLWNCTRARADRNTVQLLQLAFESAEALEDLLADVAIDFGHRPAGKLLLTSSQEKLKKLQHRLQLKRSHGVNIELVSPAECRTIEPALEAWRGTIAGGVYSRDDHAGDAKEFTRGLCERLESEGRCKLLTGVSVEGLIRQRGRVLGVRTQQHGEITSDAVIVCAGVGSNAVLRGAGLCVPIYPLKGYSVTSNGGSHAPHVSLTDLDRRIVFSNLAGRIRLAGLADCVGADTSIDPNRIADLVRLGQSVLPDAARFEAPTQTWAGLRPATPSGLPIVGHTRLKGLFLNVGHGSLGWTLACGAARQLAREMA